MIDGDLKDLYQEIILDHGKHPRNHRALAEPTADAHGHNPLCGDTVHVQVRLEGDQVADVAFTGHGCAISQASASLMTETLHGKTTTEARALIQAVNRVLKGEAPEDTAVDPDDMDRIAPLSGVAGFPMRVKCATLAWHTARSALDNRPDAKTE